MSEGFFALTVLAWLAYLASRLFRHQVPELVAFLFVGAILGPSVLGLLDEESLVSLQPLVEGALGVLMFVIGERISVRALRASRWIITSGVLQYAVTGTVMYFVALQLGAGRPTALMLAAIGGAGAPMTVASVVASAKARGKYPDGLIGTHALSDGLAATVFAAVLPVAEFIAGSGSSIGNAATRFLKLGIGGAILGLVLGWVIGRLGQQIETSGELLLFVLVHLLVAQTASAALDLSLPLAAILMGATAGSLAPTDHAQRVFVTVKTIEQPLYLIFFALAGASIHLDQVPEIGLLGGGYIAVRLFGKLFGGFFGGMLGGLPWRRATRLGFDLIPQAGVAVGLAVLAGEALPGSGNRVATIVLGSVVVFELAGSLIVSRGLKKDGGPSAGDDDKPRVADQTPKRILVASRSHTDIPTWLMESTSRWGADLVAVGRGKENDPTVEALRGRARERSVSFRWVPLRAESFAGAVIRSARDSNADMVVLLTPPARLGFESRLVLLPHERIARELSCPVLLVPIEPARPERVSKPSDAKVEKTKPEEQPEEQPEAADVPVGAGDGRSDGPAEVATTPGTSSDSDSTATPDTDADTDGESPPSTTEVPAVTDRRTRGR